MKSFPLDKILPHFKLTKLFILSIFIVLFSILYMFLDDKHFSGVNVVKETIKEEVIKKKLEKKVQEMPSQVDTFTSLTNNTIQTNVDHELDKAAKTVEQEVKEEDLTVEKIETTTFQRLFDRLYFSIITSTLLGYGDIYPVTNISKTIVMAQSLATVSLIVL
tara:strand:- start:805 stop:1290 length:486 start_codon:yes stop_codon:yes gene_type:complete